MVHSLSGPRGSLGITLALLAGATVSATPSRVLAQTGGLRTRVMTEVGIFLVYEAADPPDGPRETVAYLAYWNDFASEQLFLFQRLLETETDLGKALLNLERDLQVDLGLLFKAEPRLTPIVRSVNKADVDPTEWVAASLESVVVLMGYSQANLVPGPTGPAGPYINQPIICGIPGLLVADPLPDPGFGNSFVGNRVEDVLLFAGCGPTCQPPCSNGNPCIINQCVGEYCRRTLLTGTGCTEDDNLCTSDLCNFGSCTHQPQDGPCEADGNYCTIGQCDDSACFEFPVPNGTSCPDEPNPCTLNTCFNGLCTHPAAPSGTDCDDDGDSCTDDRCQSGSCIHPPFPPGHSCDDNDPCTLQDQCDAQGGCIGVMLDCDDDDDCTTEYCQSWNGICDYDPVPCPSDGNPCTTDVCSGGGCVYQPNSNTCTSDENACTDDRCAGGACTHAPNTAACNDGDACTSNDRCAFGSCGGEFCDDENECTDNVCQAGVGCTFPPNDCDDDNVCTSDACVAGACTHNPVGGPCDDGNNCTTNTCQNGVCTVISQIPCDDGNPCTDSNCAGGGCAHTPNTASCPDDGSPCTDDRCESGSCTHPYNTAACDDYDDCTVNDACQSGQCAGDQVDCSDDDPCTIEETCITGYGCWFQSLCDDNDPCTVDLCNTGGRGICEFVDLRVPLDPQEACTTHGCTLNLGGLPTVLRVNDDDDNNNGVADYLDAGAVTGENEIVCLTITSVGCPLASGPNCLAGHCPFDHWHAIAVPPEVGMYANLNRDPIPEFNPGCPLWPPPSPWCIEGKTASNACPYSWELEIIGYDSAPGHCCRWRSPGLTVARVSRLEWAEQPGNVSINSCPNNGGKRIFPDKLDPNDTSPNRNKVLLVATVEPPIPNVTVYFRVFDVDDPFDQVYTCLPGDDPNDLNTPCVLSVALVDGNTSGPDNRPIGGSDPAVGTYSAITGTNGAPPGEAWLPITVSMQPGNNYRASASLIQDALSQNSVVNAIPMTPEQNADSLSSSFNSQTGRYQRWGDFEGYRVPVVWSKMLTVWRKLHIEFDSMGSEPTTCCGRDPDWLPVNILTATSSGLSATLTFTPNPALFDGASEHQYEGGHLYLFALDDTWPIWNHTGQELELGLGLSPGQLAAITLNPAAIVKDDDPESGLLPKFFSVDPFLVSAFQRGYIQPVALDTELNPRTTVSFELYLHGLEKGGGFGWNNSKDQWSANDFWVSLVVAAYQSGPAAQSPLTWNKDNDPDPLQNNASYPLGPFWEGDEYNEILKEGITVGFGDWDALIFRATIIDFPRPPEQQRETHVIAHEIGHSGGNTGNETLHHAEGGLQGDSAENAFTGKTLKRFREAAKW